MRQDLMGRVVLPWAMGGCTRVMAARGGDHVCDLMKGSGGIGERPLHPSARAAPARAGGGFGTWWVRSLVLIILPVLKLGGGLQIWHQ
jgi:hypothetical protein